jgi:hypothetical protein
MCMNSFALSAAYAAACLPVLWRDLEIAPADLRLDGLAALPETLGKASPALRTGSGGDVGELRP